MAKFATYGMAGIGIAAAIGFVFALSLASNNNILLTGSNPAQQPATPFSTLQQKSQPQPNNDEENNNASLPGSQGTGARMEATINNQSATDNQQARIDLQPTLTSLVALNTKREVIGEIAPEMQFNLGIPVLIQANFANDNEIGILKDTISMEVKSLNGNSTTASQDSGNENFASFKGDIAKGANIALDLYWQPSRTGEFTILVFSTTPEDSTSTVPIAIAPIATIPVKVIE